MLFMGWQNPIDSRWRGDLGRLVVHSDLTLSPDSIEPIIQTSQIDPLSFSYPYVLESPNGGFDMWYGSTQTWDAGNGEMLHVINHAYSSDGHDWKPTGQAVPHELEMPKPILDQVFQKVVEVMRCGFLTEAVLEKNIV